MRIQYAIVFVSDMDRSVQFYRDVIGIPLRFESAGWSEFATEGSILALHAAESGDKPTLEEVAGTCRTGFQVPDMDEFHATMVGHDVPCKQPPTEVFGVKVAQYVDPDGMIFSIGEAAPQNKK